MNAAEKKELDEGIKKMSEEEMADAFNDSLEAVLRMHKKEPAKFKAALKKQKPEVRKAVMALVAKKKAEKAAETKGVIGTAWSASWKGKGLVITSGVGVLFLSTVAVEGIFALAGATGPIKAFSNWYAN